jgi:hypothetical protein
MRFLKMMSFAEPHKVLEACRATLREGFYVVYLESDAHIARWYLADTVSFLNSTAQWRRDVSAHMRNRLDIYSINYKKF